MPRIPSLSPVPALRRALMPRPVRKATNPVPSLLSVATRKPRRRSHGGRRGRLF